jgi:hypothetical protein
VVIAAPSSAKNNNDLKTIVANAENPFKADTARA